MKTGLKMNNSQKKDFVIFLQNHKNINAIYEINSGYDFMLETIHKDIKEYITFIEGLQDAFDIRELQEYQIIKEVDKEKFLQNQSSGR